MFLSKISKSFLLLLVISAVVVLPFISGCDDSGVTESTPTIDSNVVIYRDLSPRYWFGGSNDTSFMGVNLWEGQITRQVSTLKDMELIDSASTFQNFLFRSGDLSRLSAGLRTRFVRVHSDMNSARFDTLNVIPDSNNKLDSLDFTADDT